VTDGADGAILEALTSAIAAAGATYQVIAPQIGGVTLASGKHLDAQQKIDGGPSVLYDAVAIVASDAGARQLAGDKTAKDFVSDAFGHCKFIGYSAEAKPFLARAGVLDADMDEGVVPLGDAAAAKTFLEACATGRIWAREMTTDLDAAALD